MELVDDFFGRLLPFKLGNIETGFIEFPDAEPEPVHFQCEVVDGRVEGKFSIDKFDIINHRMPLVGRSITGHSFLRVKDVKIPISVRTAPNPTFNSGLPTLVSNGAMRLNLDCVQLDDEVVECSFVVSGLPRFHCPDGLRETGELESWEYDYLAADQPDRIRPLPSFECCGYRFTYILQDETEKPSQYRVSFRRSDEASMSVNDLEDMLSVWRRLFSFCSGVVRGPGIVLGLNRANIPVYGSWRKYSQQSRQSHNWLPDGSTFDFRDFGRIFIERFLKDQGRNDRERENEILDRYTRASSIIESDIPYSLLSSYSIFERLVKDKTGKVSASVSGVVDFLEGLGVTDEMSSNPLSAWNVPRLRGKEFDNGTMNNRFGVRGMKTYRDKFIAHFDDVQGVDFKSLVWYAQLALLYVELYILHEIGYEGEYCSRVGFWGGYSETVPWKNTG